MELHGRPTFSLGGQDHGRYERTKGAKGMGEALHLGAAAADLLRTRKSSNASASTAKTSRQQSLEPSLSLALPGLHSVDAFQISARAPCKAPTTTTITTTGSATGPRTHPAPPLAPTPAQQNLQTGSEAVRSTIPARARMQVNSWKPAYPSPSTPGPREPRAGATKVQICKMSIKSLIKSGRHLWQ